jgi:beta-fructofuranosidase
MAWFPKNKYCWDFWFAWDKASRLHLFYLQASQLDCRYNPDLRHDRASVGHAILTDWGWQEQSLHQPNFDRSFEPTAWDDLSIWTGSILHQPSEDLYYLFYTSRCKADPIRWTPHEWQRSQSIGIATSTDLSQWQRLAPDNLRIPNPSSDDRFDGVNWRDPYVVHNADDQTYYAFICSHGKAPDAAGIIAYSRSENLHYWQSPEILLQSDDFYQMEVPQVFWKHFANGTKRCYLVFCVQDKDFSRQWRDRYPDKRPKTGTYYYMSEAIAIDAPINYAQIQWQPEPQIISTEYYSGKLIWHYQDLQTAVMIPDSADVQFYGFQWYDESDRFVGGISDPISVIFSEDGAIKLSESP